MAHVISFRTARFDVSKETPNPTNPIAGQSVLEWLREELARLDYQVTEPATEDWGWYIEVEGGSGSYLVGASADAEGSTADVEWTVKVHKISSLKEKLLGANKLTADDPLFALVEKTVRADPGIAQVVVEKNG